MISNTFDIFSIDFNNNNIICNINIICYDNGGGIICTVPVDSKAGAGAGSVAGAAGADADIDVHINDAVALMNQIESNRYKYYNNNNKSISPSITKNTNTTTSITTSTTTSTNNDDETSHLSFIIKLLSERLAVRLESNRSNYKYKFNTDCISTTTTKDAAYMKNDDTLFVSYAKIEEFTIDFLPYINTTFVLITTPFHIIYPEGIDLLAPNITSRSYLLHWFAPNIQNYTGGFEFHHKVSPFPLGLKPNMGGSAAFRNPVPIFRQVFLETWNGNNNETEFQDNKTINIFSGYIANTNHLRKNIASGRKLNYVDYLRTISRSKYVISPDGDHPDCHRHYESIGLGAIPITQLNPYFYSHLREGHVVYKNNIWNLTELNSSLPMMQLRSVNRNLIFEEYWMEYIERIVGRPLRWWDVNQKAKATLDQFSLSSV